MRSLQVKFKLEARFSPCQETGMVEACAPALDVMTQGRTHDEAQANLIDAVRLFLQSCFERGVLDQALRDCGFSPRRRGHKAESPAVTIDVPMELVANDQNNARRLANTC